MKKIKFMLCAFMALFISAAFTSCSDDDDNPSGIESPATLPSDVKAAFAKKYPEAKAESWTKKNGYTVVNFSRAKTRAAEVKGSAWFDAAANWKMTESDDDISTIPAAVAEAFKLTKYAEWRIDDIDVVERDGMPVMYVIEVEQGKVEFDLYFLEDGTLVKEVLDEDDADDDYLPEIPAQILEYLAQNFNGYTVIDAEFDDGEYEIEFKIGEAEYEVTFDAAFQWLRTETEIEAGALPQVVADYIAANYPGFEFDDIDVVMTKDGTYFEIELEKGDEEIEIKINEKGEIIK